MNLVDSYLAKFDLGLKKSKHKVAADLQLGGKIVLLDRMVISYLRQPERYENKPRTKLYISELKNKYDKSCNRISLVLALLEGGKGNFETKYEKGKNAKKDLIGIDNFFEYAQVDEDSILKDLKMGCDVFTTDSGMMLRNQIYPKVIRKTYDYYRLLLINGFTSLNVLLCINLLIDCMQENELQVWEPLCQYCIALLVQNVNAKELFKVKGISNKNEEAISKLIHNVYSDLRLLEIINYVKAITSNSGDRVIFETNDDALKKYINHFDVKRQWSKTTLKNEFLTKYHVKTDFTLFENDKIFDQESFDVLKHLLNSHK